MKNLPKPNFAAEFKAFCKKKKILPGAVKVNKDGAIQPLKLARAWTAHVAAL